ncbi:MAG: FliM/FliN family flagellar motor switch protein [Deltaproteobacteria bacterium]|nr:FliM/FliN family flagellar motor switch protein [Deltaproteobacteria bacterium]
MSRDLGQLAFLQDIPIDLVVELGRAQLTLKELAQLDKDDVVELDRLASQPLDLLAGGQIFARGEVVVIDDRVALRITEMVARGGAGSDDLR